MRLLVLPNLLLLLLHCIASSRVDIIDIMVLREHTTTAYPRDTNENKATCDWHFLLVVHHSGRKLCRPSKKHVLVQDIVALSLLYLCTAAPS